MTDEVIQYPIPGYPSRRAKCRVRLYTNGPWVAGLLTNVLPAKASFDISNHIEDAATALVRHFAIDPSRLVIIEHHDYRGKGQDDDDLPSETFALIHLKWSGHVASEPTRRYESKARIEEVLGDNLP